MVFIKWYLSQSGCGIKSGVFIPFRLRWYLSQSGCGIKSGINTTFPARNCGSVAPRAANSSCPLVVLTGWREQSSKGRYEAVMWRAAGLRSRMPREPREPREGLMQMPRWGQVDNLKCIFHAHVKKNGQK